MDAQGRAAIREKVMSAFTNRTSSFSQRWRDLLCSPCVQQNEWLWVVWILRRGKIERLVTSWRRASSMRVAACGERRAADGAARSRSAGGRQRDGTPLTQKTVRFLSRCRWAVVGTTTGYFEGFISMYG